MRLSYINDTLTGLYERKNGELIKKLSNNFEEIAPITLLFGETCPSDQKKQIASEVREFYFGKEPIDNSSRSKVVDVSIGHQKILVPADCDFN